MISTEATPSESQKELVDLLARFSDGVQQILRNRKLSDHDQRNIENVAEIINRVARAYFETTSESQDLASCQNKEFIDQLKYAIHVLVPLKEKEFHFAHEQLMLLQEIAEVFDITLSQKQPGKASLSKKVNLKVTHPQFVGREEILNEIQNQLAASLSKPLVLYGLPGIGKSETAIKYAHLNYEKYTVIWTIAAETEETRECSYKALAEALNLPNLIEGTPEDIKKRVHRKLEQFEEIRWLLIYDNLEELISFPELGGDILITSRSREPFLLADTIEIPSLSESESITLLKRVTREEESEEMHQLAERFGYYPLALGQVANFIRLNPEMTISYYLETAPELDNRKLTPSKKRYEATLQSVFDKVRSTLPPLALEWLQVCAYFNADNISKDYLINWLAQIECSDAFAAQKILTVLVNRGLLHFDSAKQTFSMHRLFQKILKSEEGFIASSRLLLDKERIFDFNFDVDWEAIQKETSEWALHVEKMLSSSDLITFSEENRVFAIGVLGELKYHYYGRYRIHNAIGKSNIQMESLIDSLNLQLMKWKNEIDSEKGVGPKSQHYFNFRNFMKNSTASCIERYYETAKALVDICALHTEGELEQIGNFVEHNFDIRMNELETLSDKIITFKNLGNDYLDTMFAAKNQILKELFQQLDQRIKSQELSNKGQI